MDGVGEDFVCLCTKRRKYDEHLGRIGIIEGSDWFSWYRFMIPIFALLVMHEVTNLIASDERAAIVSQILAIVLLSVAQFRETPEFPSILPLKCLNDVQT